MSLLRTAATGVAWTTASTAVRSVVSLLQVSVLTRFLDKADFGIVAIATLFLGFTQIFLDLGISAGIMHKQDTTPKQYSSLFWLNIIMGVLLTGILCACSPLVAKIYNEPELTKIISLLSFTIFFSSLGNQHRTVQQKKMRFKYISIIEITTSILSLVLAIVLAVTGYGVYSLVYSNLFHTASSGLVFLIIGLSMDRNISFHFRLSDTKDYLKIGMYSIGSNVFDYFSRELDIAIISATLGKETVGVYSLCKKLVIALFATINPILTKVVTPIFAEIQKEKQRVLRLYNDLVESLAILNMPIYCLVAIFSVGILNFLYGEQYTEGALVLVFMALTYGFNTTNSPVGSLQISFGRTDLGMYWTIIRIILTGIALYIGSWGGINGISLAILVLTLISNPILWKITIGPIIGGTYKDFFSKTIWICIKVIFFSIPYYLLCHNMTNVPLCILVGFLYLSVYIVIVYAFYSKVYVVDLIKEQVLPYISKMLNKKR